MFVMHLSTMTMLLPLAHFFFALCCLGKIPGGAPFSQLHKSGNGSRVDTAASQWGNWDEDYAMGH